MPPHDTLPSLNAASSIAKLFFGELCSESEIPESVLSQADDLGKGLPEGLHDYPCVVELAANDALKGGSEAARTELARFQQSQFRNFLRENDPDERWRGLLSKVPLADGTVLWVSRKGYAKLEEEQMLDTEGVISAITQLRDEATSETADLSKSAWGRGSGELAPSYTD